MEIVNSLRPNDYQVMLASNSPRRRQLLQLILPDFEIADGRDIDESYPADMPSAEVPAYLSQIKATPYKDMLQPGRMLITADTVVINDNKILGKPHDADQAVEMLKSLSGHTHTVVTGVSLTTIDKSVTFSEHTDVTFDHLSDSEIKRYVEDFKPFDKAGAYGIQEWIGCIGIRSINGCFYNVMGLPLHSLYTHMRDF